MTKQNFSVKTASYLAGFLDGDGSVFVQIIKKEPSPLLFGLQLTLTYTQKSKRKHFLIFLQRQIGKEIAFVRDRKDGNHELAIYGWKNTVWFLKQIYPYLVLKKTQADLVFELVKRSASIQKCPIKFLESCELADKIAGLNDSKSRTNTAEYVRAHYLELKMIEK